MPPLVRGEEVDLVELLPEQHFTQPPPRYSEATLIRALEENGIGRGALQNCFARLKLIVHGMQPGTLPQKLRKNPQFRSMFREGCREICNNVFNSATVRPRRALLLAQAKKRREEKRQEVEK